MPKAKGRVLVADDERTMLELFRETLSAEWEVDLAGDGREASDLLAERAYDVAFLDLRMPGADGAELVRRIRDAGLPLKAIVMSAHAGEERRREILAGGADRFLEKPFLPQDIESVVQEMMRAAHPVRPLLVARDPAMREVLDVIDRVSPTRATVLLQGETGTGKELLAREIHERSDRRDRPFIRVNCAALAEGLLESELFGHERGSFTGAVRTTRGLFQLADRGTLLLDEISEVSAGLQAKLLRVLQEKEVRRVGGAADISVDARVVATTNRDLAAEVREGRFRADLYHRLNVIRIDVPPLRERPLDVEPLVDAILDRKAREHGLARPAVSTGAWRVLRSHRWGGNVRELENALERALLLASGRTIEAAGLGLDGSVPVGPVGRVLAGTTLRDAERELILATLDATGGNRTRASRMLGISVRTMRNKLHEYRSEGHLPEEDPTC